MKTIQGWRKKIRKILKSFRDARAWPPKVLFFDTEYTVAREAYHETPLELPASAISKPSELGVHVLLPNESTDSLFTLPTDHLVHVNAFSTETARRFELSSEVSPDPADEEDRKRLMHETSQHECVSDIPMVKEGKVPKFYLKRVMDAKLLTSLVGPLASQLEKHCYHSHIWFEKAAVYRSVANIYPEKKSTLWHTDNHYESISKVMIYLTDVGPENAPFEFLRHTTTGHCPRVKAHMPPHFPGSRVPLEVVTQYEKEGYERVQVLGPKGTVIFFDDKIIHKGNEPISGRRDVLVVQFRPTPHKEPRFLREETAPA